MIEAILENKETKEQSYLYLKNNDKLLYYGFEIKNNNIKPVEKNIVQKIYDLLRINSDCIYIEDYLDYKVYLDDKNNIKHYLKDGIEDFVMMFNNNGLDIRVYIESNDKQSSKPHKKISIGKLIISISLSLAILLSTYSASMAVISAKIKEGNISNNFNYEFLEMAYSISDYIDLGINCIDSKEALELIKNSTLPDDLKQTLANENLLNNIFPYYANTNMEYLIKPKLQNLKLRIYEPTDISITDPNTTDGFYDEMAPNVLNVKKGNNYKENAKHEFAHLLQSPNREYIFLHEGVAELISREYFDKSTEAYGYCVLNVSMLMDTIGPKVIWETVFSGDATNLIKILKSNLSESDYNELISYLTKVPEETADNCQRITKLISNLYRNMYNEEIRDNRNIYTETGYHVKRIYFNEEKMKEQSESDDFVQINEIFPDQMISKDINIVK